MHKEQEIIFNITDCLKGFYGLKDPSKLGKFYMNTSMQPFI